jgi:chemotaxis signal transduction protein
MAAHTHDGGRRLALLFEAGPARYALEVSRVLEVTPPDPEGERATVRGVFPLEDLSTLMGGAPERRPGLAVLLDTSPTLAVRVREGAEVADVAGAPHFQLTRDLAQRIGTLVRGALQHQGRLYLELRAEALGQTCMVPLPTPRIVTWLEALQGPALLFESGGTLFGVPLAQVLQISPVLAAFCPFPVPGGVIAGLLAHAGALWPVYALPAFLGQQLAVESQVVLLELAGIQVALCASRVLGIENGLVPGEEAGRWQTPDGRLVLAPDVTRLLEASNLTGPRRGPSDAVA